MTPANSRLKTSLSAEEHLGLLVTARNGPPAFDGAIASRFELTSRGDRVPGRLLLPESRSGPCPLVLALGDAGQSMETSSLDFLASWVRAGIAIATIDLSLHGERASAKFSERLLTAIASDASSLDANGKALLTEFTRQSIADVARVLDAFTDLPVVDDARVAILGLGHGAALAALAASVDERLSAVILAANRAVGIPEIDPQRHAGAIAPRPVLILGGADSAVDNALFDACGEPRSRANANCTGTALKDADAETARDFVEKAFAG